MVYGYKVTVIASDGDPGSKIERIIETPGLSTLKVDLFTRSADLTALFMSHATKCM